MFVLDERLSPIAVVQGANKRIANPPPFFATVVAYVFFGLDALSEELENPYGCEQNHLPLNALCRVNEISVAEALNEMPPEPLKAVNYQLS